MTGLWTYPWSLTDERIDSTLETLAEAGVDRFKVAAHYHSVRTFDPRAYPMGFDVFPGGCLFTPDADCFEQTPIRPTRPGARGVVDSFESGAEVIGQHGFEMDAWVVCLHGSKMGNEWPDYCIQDLFGDKHLHAFCPSHPEVRKYLAGVVENVARIGVERIDLESIGFPSVFHDHGSGFGHHKDHVVTSRTEEYLISQCFCDGCQRAADGVLDLAAAQELVERLVRRSLRSPEREIPPLAELVDEYALLERLFEFRERVVESLLSRLAEACGSARLNYYIADGGGYTPDDLWPAGVTPSLLETYLDDVTVLCYTANVDTIDHRIETTRKRLTHDLDAGVTLDPTVVDDRHHWHRLSNRVEEAIDGDLYVYNHALMTEAHLDWIRTYGE